MDVFSVNLLTILFFFVIDYSSIINAYDFQCLTCDNFIDGPGCGEFTKQIPLRTCHTFCYFAIINNRSSSSFSSSSHSKGEFSTITLTRAIRDCSPYDDMLIDPDRLLESKLGSLSFSPLVEIISFKRCNSEQCNNDFYLQSDAFVLGKSSFSRQISFPLLCLLFLIIFYFTSMF